MAVLRFALCLVIIGLAFANPKGNKVGHKRTENVEVEGRGIVDFGWMIYCGTGHNPLDYNGYGCYCGLGGHGNPVDDTDRCCQAHDQCYDQVKANNFCPFGAAAYTFPYSTTDCTNCKPASWYWFYGRCRNALCQCDAVAVKCFKKSKYENKYAGYPKSKC